MLRAKSPFKKWSSKIDEEDETPRPARPILPHHSSVQEFQELQKQQHLLNGNAWAQQASRPRKDSQTGVRPQGLLPHMMEPIVDAPEVTYPDSTLHTDVKEAKKIPAPLKLIPDSARIAVPTQRDSLEGRKHVMMQNQLRNAEDDSNGNTSILRSSTMSNSNASIEHVARPKSPGKKLFQKFFRTHTSSETPPKISPEHNERTPEKAVRVQRKEILDQKKKSRTSKVRHSGEEKHSNELEFKCAGSSSRSRANTDTSGASPTLANEFDAPTDQEIRSVGGLGRYATRAPILPVQRLVGNTATLKPSSAAIESPYGCESKGFQHEQKHLQYLNNIIPPTPPRKDFQPDTAARPPNTEAPSIDVYAALSNDPETPDNAFCVVSRTEKHTPQQHKMRYCGDDYLSLILRKPKVPSLRGASSIRSAYGFVISPSTELANGSSFGSPVSHFIESPTVPRSAGLPSCRNASFGSKTTTPPRGHSVSRRWSDTSLAAWKAQSEVVMPCLPPTFYSPCDFVAPTSYRNFTRPSANDDPSLYYLPQTTVGDLESAGSRNCSEGNSTPPTIARSSFACGQATTSGQILDKNTDTTPVSKPHRFVVKKRCSSNIAATAREHAVHGLGLSPLLDEAMHHVANSTSSSDDANYPNGPPSAMPRPLSMHSGEANGHLPAKEELDAFLSLHLHLDHTTVATHHFIDRKFEQTLQATNTKHDELLKVLSSSFNQLLDRVDGIDANTTKVDGNLEAFKADMNSKIGGVIHILQEKVLNPMSKVMESNAQLDKSVSQLITRIVELEKNQKELVGLVKAKDNSHNSGAGPSPSHSSPPNNSPHQSLGTQSYAVSYPTPYAGGQTTSSSGAPLYSYLPYYAGEGYAGQQGWGGQHLEAPFTKMPREQRTRYLQSRFGGHPADVSIHPAFKGGDHGSGAA